VVASVRLGILTEATQASKATKASEDTDENHSYGCARIISQFFADGPVHKAMQPASAEPSTMLTIQLTHVTFTDFSVIPNMSIEAMLEFLHKSLLDIVQAAKVLFVKNNCLSS